MVKLVGITHESMCSLYHVHRYAYISANVTTSTVMSIPHRDMLARVLDGLTTVAKDIPTRFALGCQPVSEPVSDRPGLAPFEHDCSNWYELKDYKSLPTLLNELRADIGVPNLWNNVIHTTSHGTIRYTPEDRTFYSPSAATRSLLGASFSVSRPVELGHMRTSRRFQTGTFPIWYTFSPASLSINHKYFEHPYFLEGDTLDHVNGIDTYRYNFGDTYLKRNYELNYRDIELHHDRDSGALYGTYELEQKFWPRISGYNTPEHTTRIVFHVTLLIPPFDIPYGEASALPSAVNGREYWFRSFQNPATASYKVVEVTQGWGTVAPSVLPEVGTVTERRGANVVVTPAYIDSVEAVPPWSETDLASWMPGLQQFENEVYDLRRVLRPLSFYGFSNAIDNFVDGVDNNYIESLSELAEVSALLKNPDAIYRVVPALLKRDYGGAAIAIADTYTALELQYEFGVLPTVDDIETLLSEIVPTFEAMMDRFKKEYNGPIRGSHSVRSDTLDLDIVVRSMHELRYTPSSLLIGLLGSAAVGIQPSLSNIWAAMPLSFVADWFVRLSDRFHAVDNQATALALKIYGSLVSYDVRRSFSAEDLDLPDNCLVDGELYFKCYLRETFPGQPSLNTSPIDPFPPGPGPSAAIGGSLLWVILRSL